MTRRELEMEFSRLNLEYASKSNEINRKKDEVVRDKYSRLLNIKMETAAKRNEIRNRIEMLRNERLKLEKESKSYEEKSEAIRVQENRFARLKEQADIEADQVNGDAYATRLQLDYEARQLSEWLKAEKLRLEKTYAETHQLDELPD